MIPKFVSGSGAWVQRRFGGRIDYANQLGVAGGGSAVMVVKRPSLLQTVGYFLLAALPVFLALALAFLFATHQGNSAFQLADAGGLVAVEKIVNELNTAFREFRVSNDERYKEIKEKGYASADVINNVEKANKAITDLSTELKIVQNALKDIETKQARTAPAGSPEQIALENRQVRQFFSLTRGHQVENVTEEDVTKFREYKKALNTYFRKGNQVLGDSKIMNALSTGAATTGGWWVTPDTNGRMIEFIYQSSPMRQLASVQTIGTDTLEGWRDLDEADSGWVGETAARPETDTPLPHGKWSIPMHEQYANPKITQKMLDDTFFPVEEWLAKKVANKFSRTENTAYVSGNGILKPKGWACSDYTAAATLVKPGATTFDHFFYVKSGAAAAFHATVPGDRFIDMIAAVKPELRNGAGWFMNSLTLAEVRKIKDGDGNYLLLPQFFNGFRNGFLQNDMGTIAGGNSATGGGMRGSGGVLLGYPVTELADLPDIGAGTFPLGFGNMAETYQIIDHVVGTRVLRDPFTGKPYISFYTTKRTGGDVLNWEAMVLMKIAA